MANALIQIKQGIPSLVLAPMEGVTDAPMRAFMGERGGFTFFISEFLRVSHTIPPAHVFRRHVPELANGCRTPDGTPVLIQILGGDPEKMARTAALAIELGSPGIDLNFGCPAPTVNRHDGGAAILKSPERVREITRAVREAVPLYLPVSAKLRLGWDDPNAIDLNAQMAAEGGASWITIHGRTKTQGYTPPAYWAPIGRVKRALPIPVIANGEIWTLDDFKRCREETECEHYMIGRGALADPMLAFDIAHELGLGAKRNGSEDWQSILQRFAKIAKDYTSSDHHVACRIKQWGRYARRHNGGGWLETIKTERDLNRILELIASDPKTQEI